MRRLILALGLLLIPALGLSQNTGAGTYSTKAPDCDFSFSFTAAGRSGGSTLPAGVAGYDNTAVGCVTWSFHYYSNGFSALQIQMEQAPASGTSNTPGTWSACTPAPGTAFPLTVTTQAAATCFKYAPWVSVRAVSVTGVGIIQGRAYGWLSYPGKDASSTGPN